MNQPPTTEASRTPFSSGGRLDALKNAAFRWYVLAMLLQQPADSMLTFASSWYAYELTGQAIALGYVVLAQALAQLIIGLGGGVISELPSTPAGVADYEPLLHGPCRMARVSVLLHTIVWQDLVVRSFLSGAISAVRGPTRQGFISEAVPREHIVSAVSINQAVVNIMQFAAPGAAGLLIGSAGIMWTFMTVAVFYALSMVVISIFSRMPMQPTRAAAARQKNSGSVFENMKEGFKYSRKTQEISLILGLSLLAAMFATPYGQLLPAFGKTVLHTTAKSLGLLNSLTGLGALIGSIFITVIRPKVRGAFFVRTDFFIGFGLILFSLSSVYAFSAAIVFVVGIMQSIRQNLSSSLIQSYTDEAYLGRVISLNMSQSALASLTAFGVAAAAQIIGVRYAVMRTSICLMLVGASYFIFSRRLRNLA